MENLENYRSKDTDTLKCKEATETIRNKKWLMHATTCTAAETRGEIAWTRKKKEQINGPALQHECLLRTGEQGQMIERQRKKNPDRQTRRKALLRSDKVKYTTDY